MNSTGTAGAILVGILALSGCVSTAGDREARPAENTPSAESSSAEPAPAEVRYTDACDMLLFSEPGDRTAFVAQATLKNSGDLDAAVRVTATWVQVGSKPLKKQKTVTVPGGGRKSVNLKVVGDHAEVSAYQAGYSSGGPECRVVARTLS